MKIGQALGAMSAYAAPTLTEQLAALQEYIESLAHHLGGAARSGLAADVYFVLDRLEEDAIPSASPVAAIIERTPWIHGKVVRRVHSAGMLAQGDARSRGVVHLDGGLWSHQLADTELRTPFLTLGSDVSEDFRNMPELPRGMDPGVREPLGPRTPAAADLAYERISQAGLPVPMDTAS